MVVIYFDEGLIVSMRDRRRVATDPLREYMVRYGLLSGEEMARLDRIQEETKFDLTDILLSEKKFSEDELREIFAEQIQESIQEILTWPKSKYKFIIGNQALQGVRTFGGMKVEGLLMESMRRIDEYPELHRLFPSDDTILKRIAPPEGKRPELERMEEEISEHLADPTPLGGLIPKCRMARFAALENLKQLFEKGLLQVTPVEKQESVAEKIDPRECVARAPSYRVPISLAAIGVLAVSLALGEVAVPHLLPPGWALRNRRAATVREAAGVGTLAPDIAGIEERLLERAIHDEIEEHLALTGVYPPSLDELAEKGLLTEKMLAAAKALGLSYRVERDGKRYSLERERS